MFDNRQTMANPENIFDKNFERREILKIGAIGFIAASVPLITAGDAYARGLNEASQWRVSFRHAHTGEKFSGVYRVGNKYLPDVFKRINYTLRDFRTHEVFPMDPHVIDLISIIQRKMDTGRSLEILSGYRSPKTNAMLRHGDSRTGVAKNSLHMYGQAIDIREEDFSSRRIKAIACNLKAGGVGYYPKSDFVHVDTGDVRTW